MHHKGLSEPPSLSVIQLYWSRLQSSRWRHLNPFAPFDEGEAQYLAYKYEGLHESHMYGCLAIVACTVVFAAVYFDDQNLEGTIFPQVCHYGTPWPQPCPCPCHCPCPSPSLSRFPLPTAQWPSPLTITTDPAP